MNARHRSSTIFIAGVLIVAAGLSWLSWTVLRSESAALLEEARRERQSQVRLALWRLDAWLGGFLSREAARSYEEYQPLIGLSPLEDFRSDYIRWHFTRDAAGALTSLPAGVGLEDLVLLQAALYDLEYRVTAAELQVAERLRASSMPHLLPEFSLRAAAGAQCQLPAESPSISFRRVEPEVGPIVPLWISWKGETTFVFVRRAESEQGNSWQGFLGDWRALENALQAQVADLFPEARFIPWGTGASGDAAAPGEEMLLAILPAALRLPPAATLTSFPTPTHGKLALVWLAAAVAVGAVAWALRSSAELGERRQKFARAMAHELRTPLTTFRMYTEMLADGTVQGEEERQEYLNILYSESGRLSGLVENVLTYAGLEENARAPRRERFPLATVLENILPPLRRQSAAAGLKLEVTSDVDGKTPVCVDLHLITGLLGNLVDNACKYAARSPLLELSVALIEHELILRLRDGGPGIPEEMARTVFEPFVRGPREDRPGVGLGLSLAQRLARASGGDLTLVSAGGRGACFELRLPADA